MSAQIIVMRADATEIIGTGHVMRCIALAQAWKDEGGEVIFICAHLKPALESRLINEKIKIRYITSVPGSKEDATDTILFAKTTGAQWIVLDGYHFGAEYQKAIKESELYLLFIDDYGHAEHYYADIVLNQNIYADMSFYPKHEQYTQFLLGTKYALIRKDFLKWSGWHRDIPEVARKILVTLGGSDPDNVTLKVIEAVKTVDLDGLEVKVVVGGMNPHFDLIYESVKDLSNFTLIKNAENMPELMAWADIAISSGGSTCWELAYMGVPSILCPIADNQKLITQELYKIRAAVGLPSSNLISMTDVIHFITSFLNKKKLRSELSHTQKEIVEGTGAKIIVSIMIGEKYDE